MERKAFPTVAILDADPDDQLLLKRALEQCRPDVQSHFFDDGGDLLDYLVRNGRESGHGLSPDLIILDFHLPGGNGFELIEQLKASANLRCLPLIVLIGSSSDAEIKRYYDLGTNTVMTRPILFDELVQILKTLCDYWFGPVRM